MRIYAKIQTTHCFIANGPDSHIYDKNFTRSFVLQEGVKGEIMRFVKREELKEGTKLAKPIYNKRGVLLYDRGSVLTSKVINSVYNFGLIGVYVLGPDEPLPEMSEEDLDREKFCSISEFALMNELMCMHRMGKFIKLRYLADTYISEFRRVEHPIDFVQNIRGAEDYVFKHSSNVAIFSALIGTRLGLHNEEKMTAILAALVHDVGKLSIPRMMLIKPSLTDEDIAKMKQYEFDGSELIDKCFMSSPGVKRAMIQAYKHIDAFENNREPERGKLVLTSKILIVADMFDRMTAMDLRGEPMSYIAAMKRLKSNPQWFDPDVVNALASSIVILSEGTCVELSSGETGIVLEVNPDNMFKPLVLLTSNNKVVDLARNPSYRYVEATDVSKSYDNRYILDKDTINRLKKTEGS